MTLENLLAIHKLQRFEASAIGVQRLLGLSQAVMNQGARSPVRINRCNESRSNCRVCGILPAEK